MGSSQLLKGFGEDLYKISLTQPPSHPVVVVPVPDGLLEATGNLTFSPANWNIPQTVTISAINHQLIGDQMSIIQHQVISDDPQYQGNFSSVAVTYYNIRGYSYNWGTWSSYYGYRYFPGVDDLEEQNFAVLDLTREVQDISDQGFRRESAGGFWWLKFEDVEDNYTEDNLEELEDLAQEIVANVGWIFNLNTVNPHGTAASGVVPVPPHSDLTDDNPNQTHSSGFLSQATGSSVPNSQVPLSSEHEHDQHREASQFYLLENTASDDNLSNSESTVSTVSNADPEEDTEDEAIEGGVAPNVQLAGLRLIGDVSPLERPTSLTLAHALYDVVRNQEIDIFNNSWMPEYLRRYPLAVAALEAGVTEGRQNFGNVYVFGAGNDGYYGSNVNYNFLANSRHTIAVGAVDQEGIFAPYTTQGTSMFITAYSDDSEGEYGVATTDIQGSEGYQRGDFNKKFGGTSAATAFVSGTVALIMDANPDLTERDVRHILADTALHTDVDNPSWTQNGAGRRFSPQYGFGVVDPVAAVEAAKTWVPVSEEISVTSGWENVLEEVPEVSAVSSTTTIEENINIESVEILLDLEHRNWGDLTVELISPDGTISQLAKALPLISHEQLLEITGGVSPRGFDPTSEEWVSTSAWTLTSNQFWGEESQGDWTLRVLDEYGNEITGEWKSWKLNLYGTEPNINNIVTNTNDSGAGSLRAVIEWANSSTRNL